MSHRSSRHRSRLPHANMRESRRVRRHYNSVNEYQTAAANEQSFDEYNVGNQPSNWQSVSWFATATPYSGTLVSGTYDPSGQAMQPEFAFRNTTGVHGEFNSRHGFDSPAFEASVWEETPIAYQPTPHEQQQVSASPTSSPAEAVSAGILETTYSLTEATPSSGYQAHQTSDPTYRDWEIATDTSSGPGARRWSTRAYQGSDGGLSGDAIALMSTNPSSTVEEPDSSDAGGDTTPVDRDQYVDGCMRGDAPWSIYQVRNCQYP
ncbi:hypothetical protein F4859DRAFT_261395 [Xylaria cf. heliscus]|nr:hypothetical protein F4859DRAFT_261395 [Xylaria cf. heliscus]